MGGIEGVVAAAGMSKRMGKWKIGLKLGDKTLIEWTLSPMLEVCDRIFVVGGFNIDELGKILKPYSKVIVIYNPNFDGDMFISVKLGFKATCGDRVFFTPADYPLIKVGTYRKLLEVKGDIILPSYRGRRGHPVLLSRAMIELLLEEPDNSTLKKFIQKHELRTVEVEDKGIITDVDTDDSFDKVKLEIIRSISRAGATEGP